MPIEIIQGLDNSRRQPRLSITAGGTAGQKLTATHLLSRGNVKSGRPQRERPAGSITNRHLRPSAGAEPELSGKGIFSLMNNPHSHYPLAG
ncbi:hypothetical protein C9924_00940 [Alloalcanivorax venustensis]|nr:hypothetical protein C9924_00940 [Alloalcanivorax venustensis]